MWSLLIEQKKSPRLLVLGALFWGLMPGVQSSAAQSLPAVEVSRVTLRDVAPAYTAIGSVMSRFDAEVAAQSSGRVVWSAELGAQLQEGEPMLRLDRADLNLQRQLDTTEIARLQAQQNYLDKQLQRLSKLRERDSSSQQELDRLHADRKVIEQQLIAAQVQLAKTDLALERCDVVAPFAGVVAERLVETGEYVTAGQSAGRLVSTTELEGAVLAPAATLRYTKTGAQVLASGENYEQLARVSRVVAVADRVSRLIEVRVKLDGERWVVGEPVRVLLARGTPQQALTVPRDALILREGDSSIALLDDQQKVIKMPVKLGFGQDDYIAVQPLGPMTIRPGDRVIVRGAERLREGQQVKVLSSKQVAQ